MNIKANDIKALNTLSEDIGPAYIEKIAPYMIICSHIHEISTDHDANRAISKLSEGLSLVASYVGAASYLYNTARFKRKQAEARAALEKAPVYAEQNGIKLTESKIEHFVALDPEVSQAIEKEQMAEAMLSQLSIIKTNIIMSMSSIKAARYGFKEDGHVSGNLV